MPANTSPIFTVAPRLSQVQISTANVNTNGSGTLGTGYIAGNYGSTVENIHIKATGTTTVGMVRLYLNDGSNTRLWHEVPVTAITQASGTQTFYADFCPPNTLLALPSGWSIFCSTEKAEAFNVYCYGGDY